MPDCTGCCYDCEGGKCAWVWTKKINKITPEHPRPNESIKIEFTVGNESLLPQRYRSFIYLNDRLVWWSDPIIIPPKFEHYNVAIITAPSLEGRYRLTVITSGELDCIKCFDNCRTRGIVKELVVGNPPPEGGKGGVMVYTDPTGAELYLDGNYVGISPKCIIADAGEHTITVKKEGYAPKTVRVLFEKGVGCDEKSITIKLEKSVKMELPWLPALIMGLIGVGAGYLSKTRKR